MPNISHDKLRRLATRAVRVLERHRDSAAFLPPYEETLVPKVERYIALYDRLAVMTARAQREQQQGSRGVASLQFIMRGWLGALKRDVKGFDATLFATSSEVPDDVVSRARQLLEVVREANTDGEPPLPYAEQLQASLGDAVDAATRELSDTQNALAELQQLRALLREARMQLEGELVAFRSALKTALGAHHRDYQKLRLPRTAASAGSDQELLADDGDGVAATEQPSVVHVQAPIAPGVRAPGGDASAPVNGRPTLEAQPTNGTSA